MRVRSGLCHLVVALTVTFAAACSADDDTAPTTASNGAANTTDATTAADTGGTDLTTTSEHPIEADTTAPASSGAEGPFGPGLVTLCGDGENVAYVAYDRATGTELWHTCTDVAAFRSPIGATDELLYAIEAHIGTGPIVPPQLVAADARDGTQRWNVELAPYAPWLPVGPLTSSGVVVAAVSTGEDVGYGDVAGIDAINGVELWRIPDDGRMSSLVAVTDTVAVLRSRSARLDPTATTTPIIMNEPPSGPPDIPLHFWAVDRVTGTLLWEIERAVPFDDANIPFFTGAVDGNIVITVPGTVAFDANSGDVLWETDTPITGVIGGAADGVFVTGGQDDQVAVAYDAATGAQLWTKPGAAVYDNVWAIGDSAVYLVDPPSQTLFAYELATGDTRWQAPFDSQRYSWPFHADEDTLYTMWTNIDAVATADGSLRWSTSYSPDDQRRFVGAVTNSTTVIVAVGGPSGGD